MGFTRFGSSQSAGGLQSVQFTPGRLSAYVTAGSGLTVAPGIAVPFCTAVRFSSGSKSPFSAVSMNSAGTLLSGKVLQPFSKARPVHSLISLYGTQGRGYSTLCAVSLSLPVSTSIITLNAYGPSAGPKLADNPFSPFACNACVTDVQSIAVV